MTRRVSSLDKTTVGIDRDISSQYDNVKIVADNILDVEIVADNIIAVNTAATVAAQITQNSIDAQAAADATAADVIATGVDRAVVEALAALSNITKLRRCSSCS